MFHVNVIFIHTARKVRTVCSAGEKQPTDFTLLVEKISILTAERKKMRSRPRLTECAISAGVHRKMLSRPRLTEHAISDAFVFLQILYW